jgi:hypothetical protein
LGRLTCSAPFQISAPEARVVIETAPGEAQVDYGTGPMVRDGQTDKYRRTQLFVLTLDIAGKLLVCVREILAVEAVDEPRGIAEDGPEGKRGSARCWHGENQLMGFCHGFATVGSVLAPSELA